MRLISGCAAPPGCSTEEQRALGGGAPQCPQRVQVLLMCRSRNRPWRTQDMCGGWGWGILIRKIFRSPKMRPQLFQFAQHCKRFSPFLAASASLLLCQGQAKAVLTYNIFESNGDVVIEANGSLNLPASTSTGKCETNGAIASLVAAICTGPDSVLNLYGISGTKFFDAAVFIFNGLSTSSTSTYISGSPESELPTGFAISSGYISGNPIFSRSTFSGQTLASIGFTVSSGLLGSWTLDGTGDTIQAFLGPPSPPSAVPGPLPLLGAGAAFGWSRRLRKRIAAPLITPPQA